VVISHSEAFSAEQIQRLNATVTCQGNGEARGATNAVSGDYVVVVAIPDEGSGFLGWYNADGELVTNEPAYGFVIREDRELVAKFGSYAVVEYDTNSKTATVEAPYPGPCTIVFVDYEGGKFVSMEAKTITEIGVVEVETTLSLNEGDKIMIWNDFLSVLPLCEPLVVGSEH